VPDAALLKHIATLRAKFHEKQQLVHSQKSVQVACRARRHQGGSGNDVRAGPDGALRA
jgi:hypothetical protein